MLVIALDKPMPSHELPKETGPGSVGKTATDQCTCYLSFPDRVDYILKATSIGQVNGMIS